MITLTTPPKAPPYSLEIPEFLISTWSMKSKGTLVWE